MLKNLPMRRSVDPVRRARRPHRKSRTGCIQCRSRKIKCDEEKPVCRYCVRHSTECSFSTTSPIDIISPSSQVEINDVPLPLAAIPFAAPEGSSLYPGLSWTDLELLHNFTVSTSKTIARCTEQEIMWAEAVPRFALHHPFVMWAMFAISALHLGFLRPDRREEYNLIAATHENNALQAYRSVLSDIDRKSGDADAAFSVLVLTYALGSAPPSGSLVYAGSDDSEAVPDWLHLVRGTSRFMRIVNLERSHMYPLSQSPPPPDELPAREGLQFAKLLTLLETPLIATTEVRERMKVYRAAWAELKIGFGMSYGRDEASRRIASFMWPIMVSEDFIRLLSRREPEALILLAHQCILLKRGEGCWFMKGHASRLITTIKDSLGKQWLAWVDWPIQQIDEIDRLNC